MKMSAGTGLTWNFWACAGAWARASRRAARAAAGAGGRLHDVALTEDDQGGRMRGALLGPEANVTLVDVRERGVAPGHRLAERAAGWQRHVNDLRRHGQALDRPHEPAVRRLAGDDPDPRPFVRHRLHELSRLQIAILRPEIGRAHV